MRLVCSTIFMLALAVPAHAETDLVLLGPVAEKSVQPKRAKIVEGAVAQAAIPAGGRKIDATCATDAVCLGIVGSELKAKRVLAVTLKAARGGIGVGFVLVDVQGKELVAKRDLTIAERKIAKDVPVELKKFLDEAPTERAKALFSQGKQHYDLGEFGPALEFYKRAYRIKALPAFLFNIAQSHRKLGQHTEAVTMYQSYLAGVPDAQNKKMVESLMAESQAKLNEEKARADATEQSRRDAERLEIERKRAEAERKTKEAEAVAAAERTKVEQARLSAERERDLEKTYNKHPSRKWTIVTGAVGAAGMIAGGVFGLQARNAQSEFDGAGCGDPDRLLDQQTLAGCVDDRDRGKRQALISTSLLAGGGVLLAASVLVFVIDPGNIERPEKARAALTVSPSSVGVVVRW